jgi:hypothetical protein
MTLLFRRLAAAGAMLTLVTLTSATANAQAIFGAAELDDDDVQLYLLGGAWNAGGLGWRPMVSLVGYNLRFDAGATTESRNVILPSVGLVHNMTTQSLSLAVGYAFSDDDEVGGVFPVSAPSGDGVVASVGWDHWGTGNRMAQILGSFNFGNEFLWSRGRLAQRLTSTSPIFVGGEAGVLGGGDDNAFLAQFGPMLEYRFTPKFRIGASAGLKVGIAEVSGSAAYGRLEFLWLPSAK